MHELSIVQEIVVHPVGGMQLSEGCISEDGVARYRGSLPGIGASEGGSVVEVLERLEKKAKAYYGEDVIVELVSHASIG